MFLDRDGVLNEPCVREGRPYPPEHVDQLRLLPGVQEACGELQRAGYTLVCITNQPDIARGIADPGQVEAIHARLSQWLPLTEIVVCPHDDDDDCFCRKPKPGMILDSAKRLDLDLSRSVTVGDRWRDVAAGQSAATATVFVDRGYAEPRPSDPDLTVTELKEAVEWMIARL